MRSSDLYVVCMCVFEHICMHVGDVCARVCVNTSRFAFQPSGVDEELGRSQQVL